jgi:hypothetical protein
MKSLKSLLVALALLALGSVVILVLGLCFAELFVGGVL